jgi:hypothetical protein
VDLKFWFHLFTFLLDDRQMKQLVWFLFSRSVLPQSCRNVWLIFQVQFLDFDGVDSACEIGQFEITFFCVCLKNYFRRLILILSHRIISIAAFKNRTTLLPALLPAFVCQGVWSILSATYIVLFTLVHRSLCLLRWMLSIWCIHFYQTHEDGLPFGISQVSAYTAYTTDITW